MKTKDFTDFAIIVGVVIVALVLFFNVWQPYVWPQVTGLFSKKTA